MKVPGGGKGVQGVLELETAGKVWGDFEDSAGGRFGDTRADAAVVYGFLIEAEDLRRLDDWTTKAFGASKNQFTDFGALLGEDQRHPRFQDSCLFSRDFFEGVAEKVFVVEINAGDEGDERRKDVGGIEAAAEADFEYGEVHALAGEGFERHGGDTFEIRRMCAQFSGGEELFNQDLDASEGFGEGGIADFFSMNANAFVDFFEVRRGIEPGPKAGVAKDGFEERSG